MKRSISWTREARSIMAVALVAFGATACSESTAPRVPTAIAMVSGSNQTLVAGGTLSSPLVVSVFDQNGSPLEGVSVSWAIKSGEGALSVETSTTDSNGQASNSSYSTGIDAGDAVITASVSGLTAIEFVLTVEAVASQ